MVLGDQMNIKIFLILFFLYNPPAAFASPDVLDGGINIASNPHRWPLIQSIPLKNENHAKTTSVEIREQGNHCILKVGGLNEVELGMKAPCDIQTMGAINSFRPAVQFIKNKGLPDEIWFEIVGNLKYYPSIRSECSKTKRAVAIRWRKTEKNIEPYLELGQISDDISAARCPRSYVEVKGPLIYGLTPPDNP